MGKFGDYTKKRAAAKDRSSLKKAAVIDSFLYQLSLAKFRTV